MRTVVLLRHGERQPGGVHLTERGARAAAERARRWRPFDRVLASPKPRAIETAEAMGYAVDALLPALEGLPEPLERWVERRALRSFADYVGFVATVEEARTHAEALAGLWRTQLERLRDGGRLLLVSHAGVIELGAVGAVGAEARTWGPTLGLLEAVRLEADGSGWSRGVVLRYAP